MHIFTTARPVIRTARPRLLSLAVGALLSLTFLWPTTFPPWAPSFSCCRRYWFPTGFKRNLYSLTRTVLFLQFWVKGTFQKVTIRFFAVKSAIMPPLRSWLCHWPPSCWPLKSLYSALHSSVSALMFSTHHMWYGKRSLWMSWLVSARQFHLCRFAHAHSVYLRLLKTNYVKRQIQRFVLRYIDSTCDAMRFVEFV